MLPWSLRHFAWDNAKNEKLQAERGISFEDAVFHIERGDVLKILNHPDQDRYVGQKIMILQIDDYAYLVPQRPRRRHDCFKNHHSEP